MSRFQEIIITDFKAVFKQFALPSVFVILWSTGFIGAKYGLPYAEPFTFLSIRFFAALCILVPIVLVFVGIPQISKKILHSIFSGMLIHGVYLGAIFFAIDRGMSAGISSLIVVLQPLLVSLIAWFVLGERVSTLKVITLLSALLGVGLVLSPKILGGYSSSGITPTTVFACFIAVLAISIGTVYQKKYVGNTDLRVSATAQYFGALILLGVCSAVFETGDVKWTNEFIFALGWLVLVLSIGAVSVLLFLIRKNSAVSTASLFYLVPVSTTIIAYFVFGEALLPIQLLGMGIAICSVAVGSSNN